MQIFSWFKRDSPEVANARALLKAIDRGGIPSNPAKVNDIARKIGLTVSPSAPMQETLNRIRSKLNNRWILNKRAWTLAKTWILETKSRQVTWLSEQIN